MEKRQISFSPPDITEAEVSAVADVLRSDWISTGPRSRNLRRGLLSYAARIRLWHLALLLRVLSRYSDS